MSARLEHLVTSGTFSLDGQTFDVDNNVWILGDDDEVIVFDAPHDPDAIEAAVGDRTVVAIACTHAHDDHVRYAPELAERLTTQVLLHPEDRVLWDLTHARHEPDGMLREGQVLEVAGTRVHVLHTPGHAPGAVCFSVPDLGAVLSGDTLFSGGPGATGRSYSDYSTILDSIRTRLLTLPPETRVLTGHGDETTVGAEAPSYDAWVKRLDS
ncbi:MAG: MBL fold metallo-hydrolase [Frankiaceae bacterium]|nr:MBL fold metallo-hydrolase [Frankiaceae bacterium]